MERNILADIDWAYMRATFLVVVSLLSVLLLVGFSEEFYKRFGVKLDAYLLRMFRRWDERKARKTR
jgi:hypothetical protein